MGMQNGTSPKNLSAMSYKIVILHLVHGQEVTFFLFTIKESKHVQPKSCMWKFTTALIKIVPNWRNKNVLLQQLDE
jgi:hypothetical protein